MMVFDLLASLFLIGYAVPFRANDITIHTEFDPAVFSAYGLEVEPPWRDGIDEAKSAVEEGIRAYPNTFLQRYVTKVYLGWSIARSNRSLGGTVLAEERIILLADNIRPPSEARRHYLLLTLHHEVCHLVLHAHSDDFPWDQWQGVHPIWFRYAERILPRASGDTFSYDDRELSMGFMRTYGRRNIEEDVCTYAERLFAGEAKFWKAYEQWPLVRAKADLLMDFLHGIDDRLTREYFARLVPKTVNSDDESPTISSRYDDGTLASYAGTSYTRVLEYDEEQRLIAIERDDGGSVTTAFTYGYAFDGQRRWRKDHLGDRWDWYPCGVACCAGELVALTSDLTGSSWSTLKTVLPGSGGSRHGSYFGGRDVLFPDAIATGSSASFEGWRIRDRFGVARHVPLAMPGLVPYRPAAEADDEQHYHFLNRFLPPKIEASSNRLAPPTTVRAPFKHLDCLKQCIFLCQDANFGDYNFCWDFCAPWCLAMGKGFDAACERLWKWCFRLRPNHMAQKCLGVYLGLCHGR
jgi:hypothetical protein